LTLPSDIAFILLSKIFQADKKQRQK